LVCPRRLFKTLRRRAQQIAVCGAQIYTEQKNTKKLKELYQRALAIKSAIPHPRIMAIIRECGGKMHMHERIWSEAATDFFEVRKQTLGDPVNRHVLFHPGRVQ